MVHLGGATAASILTVLTAPRHPDTNEGVSFFSDTPSSYFLANLSIPLHTIGVGRALVVFEIGEQRRLH